MPSELADSFPLQVKLFGEARTMLSVADGTQRGRFDAHWCGQVVPPDSFYGLLAEHGHRICPTPTSPPATPSASAGPRSRRATWPRSSCSPIARGHPTSRRWSAFALTCAGRWPSGWLRAQLRRLLSAGGQADCQGSVSVSANRTSTRSGASAFSSTLLQRLSATRSARACGSVTRGRPSARSASWYLRSLVT